MDFTLKKYKLLLKALVAQGYYFQTFTQYITSDKNSSFLNLNSSIILRHDVEAHYEQALKFAQIQNQLGIKGTYFFRLLPKSFRPEIVKQIADLGHEIGYHYDDLAVCKGDYKKAIARFQKNIETLREIAPVQTICMDGSPLSQFDNKDLWRRDTSTSLSMTDTSAYFDFAQHESLSVTDASALLSVTGGDEAIRRQGDKEIERQGEFNAENTSLSSQVPESLISTKRSEGENSNKEQVVSSHTSHSKLHPYYSYKDFGIVGEPYFDIDFSQVFYLTDTGRMWNGEQYSVRDKVVKEKATDWPSYHKTEDIINAVKKGDFPKQSLLTFHPQRWNDAFLPWLKELLWQNAKNQVKRILVKRTKS